MLSRNGNISKLVTVDFMNESSQSEKSLIFVGAKAKSIIRKTKNNNVIVTEFLQNFMKAYAKCVRYMSQKFPFHNTFF